MLIVVKILIAVYMWLIFPVILGNLWIECGDKIKDRFFFTYLMGLVSEWAVFFVLAKWAIVRQMTLHELCRIWLIVLILLTFLTLGWTVKKQKFHLGQKRKWNINVIGVLSAIVILAVISIACGEVNQNEYTVESVLTMYATDTLYQYDAATGQNADEMLSFQKEELENDAEAPIEAYYAVSSFMCKLNPTKFIRIVLPVFLLTFYFGVYHVWAKELFGESEIKRITFQIVVWLLYGIAVVSERAILFDVFLNCWNGETLFFVGLLPMAVWLLLCESNRTRCAMQYVVCALAGQLLYVKGGFMISFLWGSALMVSGIKRWKDDSSI